MTNMNNPLPNFNFGNFKNLEDDKNIIRQTLDVDTISLNPNNHIYNQYDTDEDITELAEFIKITKIYDAIIVKKLGRNSYEIISGEKRFRALTEKLHYTRVDCIIIINPTPEQEEGIFDGPNLTQRSLTSEQKFKGYLRLQQTFEKSVDKKKYESMLKISSYRRTQFENIVKNVSDEKIQQFQSNELSFNDLVEAAELQKRLNQEQRRVNEAVKIYSDAKGNPNTRYYIDRNGHLIYRVKQRNYKNNVVFAVTEKDYTLDTPDMWVKTRELPECDTQEEMQTLLDKYAVVYKLEECSAEEYITLLEKVHKEKSENKNQKSKSEGNHNDEKTSNTDTLEDIRNNANDKNLLGEMGIAEDSFDTEGEDYPDEEGEFLDYGDTEEKIEKEKPTDVSEQEDAQTPKKSDDTNKVEEDNENPQLDLIANNYALNLLFRGLEKETGNTIRRGRLVINSEQDRYFLIQNDVKIEEQILQPNGVNAYRLKCYAYEVDPASIKLEK